VEDSLAKLGQEKEEAVRSQDFEKRPACATRKKEIKAGSQVAQDLGGDPVQGPAVRCRRRMWPRWCRLDGHPR
jgi:hypothetical protein